MGITLTRILVEFPKEFLRKRRGWWRGPRPVTPRKPTFCRSKSVFGNTCGESFCPSSSTFSESIALGKSTCCKPICCVTVVAASFSMDSCNRPCFMPKMCPPDDEKEETSHHPLSQGWGECAWPQTAGICVMQCSGWDYSSRKCSEPCRYYCDTAPWLDPNLLKAFLNPFHAYWQSIHVSSTFWDLGRISRGQVRRFPFSKPDFIFLLKMNGPDVLKVWYPTSSEQKVLIRHGYFPWRWEAFWPAWPFRLTVKLELLSGGDYELSSCCSKMQGPIKVLTKLNTRQEKNKMLLAIFSEGDNKIFLGQHALSKNSNKGLGNPNFNTSEEAMEKLIKIQRWQDTSSQIVEICRAGDDRKSDISQWQRQGLHGRASTTQDLKDGGD